MCWGEGRAVWRPPCTAFRNYHGMFKSRSLNSERNHMLRFSGGFIQGILRAWDLCPLIQSIGMSKNNVRLFFECAAFLFWSPPRMQTDAFNLKLMFIQQQKKHDCTIYLPVSVLGLYDCPISFFHSLDPVLQTCIATGLTLNVSCV